MWTGPVEDSGDKHPSASIKPTLHSRKGPAEGGTQRKVVKPTGSTRGGRICPLILFLLEVK